jgi:hypothetical protein
MPWPDVRRQCESDNPAKPICGSIDDGFHHGRCLDSPRWLPQTQAAGGRRAKGTRDFAPCTYPHNGEDGENENEHDPEKHNERRERNHAGRPLLLILDCVRGPKQSERG